MAERRTEFTNKTQGYLGVVKINRKGDPEGRPVAPGERVWLTDEEIELTDEAPAHREDSPFQVREIVHFDEKTGDEADRFTAAPLEKGQVKPAARTRRKATAAA